MGMATAYFLSKTPGVKVTLLEQYIVENEYCSSNDANRVFRYAYGKDKLYTEMAVESLKLWRELERETGQTLLVPTGLLLLNGADVTANVFNNNSYRTLKELGLGSEKLDEAELKRRYPSFSATEAYFDPHGSVILASRVLSVLARQSMQSGVRVLENCRATEVTGYDELKIQTSSGGTISCRKIVVAAGSWSNKLRREGLPSVTPTRQQLVYFTPEADLEEFRPLEFPIFFGDQYYGLPAVGFDGVKVSHKNLRSPVDPDNVNRTVDDRFVESARSFCSRFVPKLARANVTRSKVCLYDMTENSDFVIGPDPDRPNIIYAYGFSGHGFKFATLVGKLLAQLALEKPVKMSERFSPTDSHGTPVSGPPY